MAAFATRQAAAPRAVGGGAPVRSHLGWVWTTPGPARPRLSRKHGRSWGSRPLSAIQKLMEAQAAGQRHSLLEPCAAPPSAIMSSMVEVSRSFSAGRPCPKTGPHQTSPTHTAPHRAMYTMPSPVLALVATAVRPSRNAVAVHAVRYPLALVRPAVGPRVEALAVEGVVQELALVRGAIRPTDRAMAGLLPRQVLSAVP